MKDRPKWKQILASIQEGFPSPWKETAKDQLFEDAFKKAIEEVNNLKHNRSYEGEAALKSYLSQPNLPDYSDCKHVRLNYSHTPHNEVILEAIKMFEGMSNWGHPLSMSNVIPPPNTASIVAASLSLLLSPSIVDGRYSWNVAKAEIESSAILADLIGWDPIKAGGVYTFGGTGSYLYGIKFALASVFGKGIRETGVREEGQMLVAESGHYAKYTCADWSGLGINNIRSIAIDAENKMDIQSLKMEMQRCREENKPIVMIVCTMGSTDAFAIDPVDEIRKLIDDYENAKGYPKPLLYADAVIGWTWMSFKNYDFEKNPLEFSKDALEVIKVNYSKMKSLALVDAIGVDFHKTGWAPCTSSFILVQDFAKFTALLARDLPPYLQFSTDYNPFIFTLETSRGASGALAGWASLKFFGYEGYQVMCGRIIEVMIFFRKMISKEKNIVCINSDNYGFVNLFRVYPKHVDAKVQYELELNDPCYSESLNAYNQLQKMIANKLFAMLRDPNQKVPGWEAPPNISLTQGYRSPKYAPQGEESTHQIYALKAFPMSPFSNEISMLLIRNFVLKARDLVIEEILKSNHEVLINLAEQSGEPYFKKWYGDVQPIEPKFLLSQNDFWVDELRKIPFFSQSSDSELQELIKRSKIETVEAGTVIFNEGDSSDHFYVILDGKVRSYKIGYNAESIELAMLGKGEFFGEMTIFANGKRRASALTIEECTLFKIQGRDFLDLLF